jgi:hypothetical protein
MSESESSLIERDHPKRTAVTMLVIVVAVLGFLVALLLLVDLTNDSDDGELVPAGSTAPSSSG